MCQTKFYNCIKTMQKGLVPIGSPITTKSPIRATARLNDSTRTITRLIKRGVVPARQACKGAPRVISADALELLEVAQAQKKEHPRRHRILNKNLLLSIT